MSGNKADLDWGNMPFSYIKTDYNLRFYYKDGKWSEGEFSESDEIPIHIAAPSLHYGQQAFEGIKAFETKDGKIVIFRPEENAKRLQKSCKRISIPEIPVDIFVDAVKRTVKKNERFVPPYGTGASLYIRPVIFGSGAKVGLGPAPEYTFIVFVTPVGPYYKGGFKPVEALVVQEFDRAAPLGVGDCKVGGNYAAGLRGSLFASEKGYPVALYLDAKEKKYIDEFSTSNFIGIKGNSYVTPSSPTILKSITNDSLVMIAEDQGMNVEKRDIPVTELEEFDEVGAVGTAAVITPVSHIHFEVKDYTFGDGKSVGKVMTKLYEIYSRIQTGEIEDKFNWLTEV